MSMLPRIDSPTFNIKLPVSKVDVKIRPYTVKEQKILLMASESRDEDALVDTILQIVNNCVVTPINVVELPLSDVEYVFYQLRARSQSEMVDLRYKCESKVNGESCGNVMEHQLNLLTDLEVTEGLPSTIKLTDKIGVKLKHQRFEKDPLKNVEIPSPDQLFTLIAKNVDVIFDERATYNTKDLQLDDVIEFLGSLSTSQYEKIEEFFLNEPKIHKNLELTCKKCGTLHKVNVEDVFDFFI